MSLQKLNDIVWEDIEAIIFDLGGVIIEVDMDAPYRQLLSMSKVDSTILLPALKEIAYQYEVGQIDDRQFFDQVKITAHLSLSDRTLSNLWNQMLGKVPSYIGDLLTNIKQSKKTFVLSNTNPIHIQEFEARFNSSVPDYPLESLFTKIYYSYNLTLHKPDRQIFTFVIKDSCLNPAKTLFIDDNLQNVQGAISCGLQAIHMNPPMSLPVVFSTLNIDL